MPTFSPEQRLAIAIGVPALALLFLLWYRRRQRDEDDDDDEPEPTVASVFETKIEVKIPQYLVGTVIGRGGANIKQIQKDSGAYLRFKDDEEENEVIEFDDTKPVIDREKTRTIIIKGEREKVRQAEFLIKKIINEQPKVSTEEYYIPQRSCGRIIGRGGMTIRHLSKVSGKVQQLYSARINILRDEVPPDVPRKCTITGTTDQIANAKGLLDEKIAEHEQAMARRPDNHVSQYQSKDLMHPINPDKFFEWCSCNMAISNVDVKYLFCSAANQELSFPSSVQYPNTSDYTEVFVSAIDTPGHFYVQLVRTGDAQKLDQLIDTLTDEASAGGTEDIIDSIQVGIVCSAPFAHDDSRYRAKVTQINNDGTVGLYYGDYGDHGTVPKYKLRKIRDEHLQLPYQAIECYLANTRPKGDNWDEHANDDFEELTHYPNWVGLMAKGVKYCGDIPCLDLYDTTSVQDIYINNEMVKRGYAVEDTCFPPQPPPPVPRGQGKDTWILYVLYQKSVLSSFVSLVFFIAEKSVTSVVMPLTENVSNPPPFDEEDARKDLGGPVTQKEFSPIKSALVKRVSKDYTDTAGAAIDVKAAVQEPLVESVPEMEFMAEVQSTPEVDIPTEASLTEVGLSNSGSQKLSASQMLKPEVREMIQIEVSQAFESQLVPSKEVVTQSLIHQKRDIDEKSSYEDIEKHQQEELLMSDSGIELRHDEDGKHVETMLSDKVNSHNQPSVTQAKVTETPDKDDDDDDDNLETFTTTFQNKKTFVSSVTVTSSHTKRSTVTLVQSDEKKDSVTESQSSKRSYAQAVRTSQEYENKDETKGAPSTGSDVQEPTDLYQGNHGNNVVVQRIDIQSKPDENTLFDLQQESMSTSFNDVTMLTSIEQQASQTSNHVTQTNNEQQASQTNNHVTQTTNEQQASQTSNHVTQTTNEQQASQTSNHVTQTTNQRVLPNGQKSALDIEKNEVLKLDRKSPMNLDSDSESYVSALDEPASDTDTTSYYDTAADRGSNTSLDYLTPGNDTDTDTLKPHGEELGTPVNSDDDTDNESQSGNETPKRNGSGQDDAEAGTPTASGLNKFAAKYLSDMDLGYRGDTEDVMESTEDLR
ncbi:hypothetical protein QZH41_013552 [Actinostola sp. cb2023]|nr:hypothetical protein QZH41_013552 [Actinostola sp. cb2023]